MRELRKTRAVRAGAAVVEMAAVLIVFVMLLFGILEYCRLIFVRQVVENAAREGARYAVVNTYDDDVVANTRARVKDALVGLDKMPNYKCDVYMADTSGKKTGSAVDAPFGTYVAVDVSLTYTPITPGLLFLSNNLTVASKCCMGSEAN